MSSSFIGQSIGIRLHSGGSVRGKIVSIDGSTGSLSIVQADGTQLLVTRAEIADLKMLSEEKKVPEPAPAPAPAPVPSPSHFQDPAIISYTQETRGQMSSSNKLQPASSPMPASYKENGSTGKQNKVAKAKGQKVASMNLNVGTSSRTQTEDETEYEATSRNGKKAQPKNKKKNQQRAVLVEAESDIGEDFDFDKALKSFDKRKIWQEIKTTDQTDPKTLLVSHNRLNGGGNEGGNGRYQGRSAQDKLGLHEPVLSPSPTASHDSLPSVEEMSLLKDEDSRMVAELQRVRGNALQREMENSKLKDEIRRLSEKVRVLESLGGVEVTLHSDDVDGHKWKCVIYESMSAHTEAKRSTLRPALGSLTFLLKTFQGETSKLRYLGIVQGESDAATVEKLPPQYKGEMGLKTESAAVFMRRIREAVQAK